jgi:predicted DNA-binding protein (UPF0251 family)
MNKLVKIGGGLIVLVALAALIGSTITLAQDDTEPEAPVVEAFGDGPGNGPGFFAHRGPGGRLIDPEAMKAALAAELGITVEELEAAQEAALGTVLQQLVDEGQITQAQADSILAGEGLRGIMQSIFTPEMAQAAVAEALGISVEELEAAQAEGQRLHELAVELGVDPATIGTAVAEARAEAIQAAVEDGTITQAQADQLLNQNRPGFGGHRGPGRGGPGRFPGGPGGQFGPGGFDNSPDDGSAS